MRENQPRKDMDLGFFRSIAKDMRLSGVEELGLFFLGESFSNPTLLVEACRISKELGFPYIFLTTNGSLARPWHVENLMRAGLNSLKWSVNASDEVQFREVMGVSPKLFRRSLENLKEARAVRDRVESETGHRCGLYASSIRFDGEQQQRMEELLRDFVLPYVDEHYWLPLYSMGSFATQREAELGYRPIAGNQGRLEALREPLPCWSAFSEGHITVDGKLSACCFDANANWEMADLRKVSFMEGWNSPKFQHLRKAHLVKDVSNTVCKDCIAYS